jgi:hypothetical protein
MLVAPVPFWFVFRPAYWLFNREDHVAEWATCLAYLAVTVIALLVGRHLWRRQRRVEAALYLVLAVGAFGIAGEEISWGQRLLGISGPSALVEANQQNEMNLHNLLTQYPLEGAYIIAGLLGAFGLRRLAPRIPRLRDHPWLFAPPAQLGPWFLPVVVYYGYIGYVDPIVDATAGEEYTLGTIDRLQEGTELSLAIGVLAFLVAVLLRIRAGGLTGADPVSLAEVEAEVPSDATSESPLRP